MVACRRPAAGRWRVAAAVAAGKPWHASAAVAACAAAPSLLFIDLETTGLAGGAGTYAFLVGCGVVRRRHRSASRQFFLSSFAAERALLEAVADVAATAGTVVTYNGKSFDLPLIETRFALHRLATPFAGAAAHRHAASGAAPVAWPTGAGRQDVPSAAG